MREKPRLVVIAAVSRNGVIGRGGHMPWHLSTDLKRFKALTLGKPVILGRKTFDSLGGRPLPGRPHVVVTRDRDFPDEGVEVAASLDEAIAIAGARARELGVDEICIIGGGEIYAQAITLADLLRITHVEADIEGGDAFFPAIDPDIFAAEEEEVVPAGEKDTFATRFVTYGRRGAPGRNNS